MSLSLAFTASASAGTGLGVIPAYDNEPRAVGTGPYTAHLQIVNTSDDLAGEVRYQDDTFQVLNIQHTPTCGSQTFTIDGRCPTGAYDPEVLELSPTGLGRVGTACAGQVFDITLIDPAEGRYSFTTAAPVILGPSAGPPLLATCSIDFTYTIVKAPERDSDPLEPGLQSSPLAAAQSIDITPGDEQGQVASGTGSSEINILRAQPSITTRATGSVVLGGAITDTAIVSGRVNPTAGGTVSFRLYGPDDPTSLHPAPRACSRRRQVVRGGTRADQRGRERVRAPHGPGSDQRPADPTGSVPPGREVHPDPAPA